MTISQALTKAIQKLQQNKIPTPHLDAEILLSHILKKPREYILAHPEKQLTKIQISNIQYPISRRINGHPIAYITNQKQFYGLDFYVNKNVLIPRPETELMVDEALRITHNVKRVTIIDVGTGSGCIIISLIKNLNSKFKIQNSKFYITDISKPALAIARKNAKLHNVHKKIKFFQGSLLQPIIKKWLMVNDQCSMIILANLPYLTPAQIKNSPSIRHEPKLALSAGPDGLKYYRELFKQIKRIKNQKLRITVLIEIDSAQTKKIRQLIKKELPRSQIKIKKDLRGHNRLIVITI